jgi:hypothetical protein
MTRKRPVGRPRGSSAKLNDARALIAAGVEPLTALMQAGYTNPRRAYATHAAPIAQSQGLDPIKVAENIARFGLPPDQINACDLLLKLAPKSTQHGASVGAILPYVIDAAEYPQHGVHVWTLPRQVDAALAEYDRLVGGEAATEARFDPRAILMNLLVRSDSQKDSDVVRACKLLLTEHGVRAPHDEHTRYVFDVPHNNRQQLPGSIPQIHVRCADGSDACRAFEAALQARNLRKAFKLPAPRTHAVTQPNDDDND